MAGLSMYRAAIEAGYADAVAWNEYAKVEGKPQAQAVLKRWMEREGISDVELIGVI
jgi:hypothetical protein